MATIAALMVKELITAESSEAIASVAQRMAGNRVGAVLVVEGDKLIGVLTERDLLTRVLADRCDPDTTGVGDVQTKTLVTVDVKQSLKDALQLFRQGHFRHLPVLENGKPVGILSTSDLHAYLVEGFERFIDDLKFRNELADGTDPYDHFGGQYGR